MRTAVPITIVGVAGSGKAVGKTRAVVNKSDASQGAIAKNPSEDLGFEITRAVMHPTLNSQKRGGIRKKTPLGIVSFNQMRDKIERMVSKKRVTIRNCRPFEYPDACPLIHNKAGKTR